MLLFYFRLRTRLSSEKFLASEEDIQNFAGLEQSYPVQRSLDLEGNNLAQINKFPQNVRL